MVENISDPSENRARMLIILDELDVLLSDSKPDYNRLVNDILPPTIIDESPQVKTFDLFERGGWEIAVSVPKHQVAPKKRHNQPKYILGVINRKDGNATEAAVTYVMPDGRLVDPDKYEPDNEIHPLLDDQELSTIESAFIE